MKKYLITLLLILPSFLFSQTKKKAHKNENQYHSKIDTVYKVPNDEEIFYYNGFEAPENSYPDFTLKEGEEKVPFKIDKICEMDKPKSCVSLYHYELEKGTKWLIRASVKATESIRINYSQRMGKDGAVISNTTTLNPGQVKDLGYAAVGDEVDRHLWIVSTSWEKDLLEVE
ncbi:MAG: hypothetical protein RJQ00_05465 [Vicingaceae bacterium]